MHATNKQCRKGSKTALAFFDQLTVYRLYTQCQKKPLSNLSPDPYFLGDSDVTRPFGQHTEFSKKQKGEPTMSCTNLFASNASLTNVLDDFAELSNMNM